MPQEPREQLELIGPRGGLLPRPRSTARAEVGEHAVQVVIDSPLRRLDRVFDYAVPRKLQQRAVFGMRVRVPFAGQRVDGFIVGQQPAAIPLHELLAVQAVLGTVPVLTPASLGLCRAVAEHYAGTLADVLRLAVPPRHAGAELAEAVAAPALLVPPPEPSGPPLAPGPGRWGWTCPPGTDWTRRYAHALVATAAAGATALAVVPDGRDLRRLVAALAQLAPGPAVAVLSAAQPPAERYRAFLRVLAGVAPIVVGTRSAALAPVADPALLLLWDDGDDSHAERRAPYPHVREVLGLRAGEHQSFVVGGYGRSPNVQRWIEIGWAREVAEPPRRPGRVRAARDDERIAPGPRGARIPPAAAAAIRAGLAAGPVLVGTARRGYLPRVACRTCRRSADCATCGGPLGLVGESADAACLRCGRSTVFRCPHCGDDRLRSVSVGSERTAQELGRSFPGVPVLVSSGNRILDQVPDRPSLVVATPGAEPVAEQGYRAVVLLDAEVALALPGLRSAEHAARRWFAAAGLGRCDAPIVLVAEPGPAVVQALLRWDPAWFARRELAARAEAGMPPAMKAVEATGDRVVIDALRAVLPEQATVLGPVPAGADRERILILAPHRAAAAVLRTLREHSMSSSAAKEGPVVLRVDPVDLL
jgi:primosomal protein N' (replication factor Y)